MKSRLKVNRDRLHLALQEKLLNKAQFAKEVGISLAWLSKITSSKNPGYLSIDTAQKMLKILGRPYTKEELFYTD